MLIYKDGIKLDARWNQFYNSFNQMISRALKFYECDRHFRDLKPPICPQISLIEPIITHANKFAISQRNSNFICLVPTRALVEFNCKARKADESSINASLIDLKPQYIRVFNSNVFTCRSP